MILNSIVSNVKSLEWRPADYVQIITSILTFLTVVTSLRTFAKQLDRDRRIKAVEVGRETERLTVRWAYIDMVLKDIRPYTYAILSEADAKKMDKFESKEIASVYSTEQIEIIKKTFTSNRYNSKYSGSPPLQFVLNEERLGEINCLFPQVIKEVFAGIPDVENSFIFHRVLIDTLNRMETLCIMMDEKLADEKVVFISVNDKFIHIVKVLYYYIAMINDNTAPGVDLKNDKKLKHIINVFRKWKKRRSKRKKKK